MNHDNFTEVTSEDAPDFKVPIHFKSAWAQGYNTCLERTNAAELLQALIGLIERINPQDVTPNKQFMGLNLGKYYVGGASIPSGEAIHKAINAIKKATDEK